MNCGNDDPQRTKNADALLPDNLQALVPLVDPTVSPDVSPTPSFVDLVRCNSPKRYRGDQCDVAGVVAGNL
jgi:hypothetical protein